MSTGIPSGPDPLAGQVDNLSAALRAAPELQNSPGAALALSDSQTPAADSQAIGLSLNAQAAGVAANNYQQATGKPPPTPRKRGWLSKAWNDVSIGSVARDISNDVIAPIQRDVLSQKIPGTPTGTILGHKIGQPTVGGLLGATGMAGTQALQLANTPLKDVQHNYRYIRDVWQRHGVLPAVAELMGMVGGGILTDRLTGSANAGILAGEAIGAAEGQVFYRDSWARTANGNAYRDASGQLVSPGRDVANALNAVGRATGIPGIAVGRSGFAHGLASGSMDGVFDMILDPVAKVGGLYGEAKGPTPTQGVTGWKLFAGTGATKPGDALALYDRGPTDPGGYLFRRAVNEIADTGSAAQIGKRYPAVLRINGMADELARADTTNQVLSVFEDHLNAESAIDGSYTFAQGLPVTSRLGQTGSKIIDYAEERIAKATALEKIPLGGTADLTGDKGWENVRQNLLMGLKPRAVRIIGDAYLTASPADRLNIIKMGLKSAIINRAGISVDELSAGMEDVINAEIDARMGGESLGRMGQYAAGGPEMSQVMIPEGTSIAQQLVGDTPDAVAWNQTLDGPGWEAQLKAQPLLAYKDFKDLGQHLKGYRDIFQVPGKVDDFFWNNVTSPWAKLSLLTGSFASHIIASENLLNVARNGFRAQVQGAMAALAGKLGYQVNEGDAGPITAFVYHALGDRASADNIALATHVALATDGAMVTPEASANWVIPSSAQKPVEQVTSAVRGLHAISPDGYSYMMLGDRGWPNVDVTWANHLNEIADSPGGRRMASMYMQAIMGGLTTKQAETLALDEGYNALLDLPEDQLRQFLRSDFPHDPRADKIMEFARWRLEALKGAVTGADGTLHTNLLESIANDFTVSYKDVAKIDPAAIPDKLPNRWALPNPMSRIDRLAEVGHQKILSPLINVFSRQPTFMADVIDAYKAYKPIVDSGTLDQGIAMDLAMEDASRKTIKFIHNPQERLQATETLKNIAPFGFAQVQAYKRFGRLLLSDPGAFRRMQLALTGMTDLANRTKDASGFQQVVYPGSGYITHGMLQIMAGLGLPVTSAVPVAFAGSTTSLQAVDPFMQGTSGIRPSIGPLVSVGAHLIDGFDPNAKAVVSSAVGPIVANESNWSLIPNTPVRDAIEGLAPAIPGLIVGNDSIWMHTIANLDYAQNQAVSKWQGTQQYQDMLAAGVDPNSVQALQWGRPNIVPPPEADPLTRQRFVDSVKNQSRFVRFIQAAMAEVVPASPQALIGNKKIPADFQKMVQKSGIAQARVDFATKYPDADPLLQSMSKVADGGVLDATASTQKWIDNNKSWVKANPAIASFFVPQTTDQTYSQSAYNEQLAMGLRSKDTPQEFQNDFYINSGWAVYEQNRAVYNQQVAQGTDPVQLKQAWSQWLVTFKAQHPVWAAAFDSPDNTIQAQQSFQQMKSVISSGSYPKNSPQVPIIKNLITQYENYVSMLRPGSNGIFNTSLQGNLQVTQAWEAWLKNTASSYPETAPIINKIFRWLTPTTPQAA